jgi:hypothetical protein
MPLSLVKLNSGTELIGEATIIKGMVQITDPLQINYKFVSFQPMPTVSVSRYMPFAATPAFSFELDQVSHIVEPKASMIEYYQHALDNYRDNIDGIIDDELMGVVGRSEIRKSRTTEELYAALLERLEPEGPPN